MKTTRKLAGARKEFLLFGLLTALVVVSAGLRYAATGDVRCLVVRCVVVK